MRRTTPLLIAAASTLLPLSAYAAFSDVPDSHLHAQSILYVELAGIVGGYPDGTYKPDNTINRAELTKIVMEAAGKGNTGADCFPDVRQEWFAGYVCAAKAAGFIGGYPDGAFKPADTVTFVEAAKIIAGAWELDLPSIGGPWYAAYVASLEGDAAIPRDIRAFGQPLTRAQMAAIIHRLHAGITDLPTQTYAALAGEEPQRSSSSKASSRATSSKAATGAFPLALSIGADWRQSWGITELNGTTETYKNVTVLEEPGEPGSFFRIALPANSGTRHNWTHYGKPLSGIVAWADPGFPPAKNLWFRQRVRFPAGFEFHKGGSLPGVFTGGTAGRGEEETGAVWINWEKDGRIAVGGRFSDKDQRTENYLPGASTFKADGAWHTVDLHVTLNTEAKRANGVIEVWYDGVKVAGAESVMFPTRTGDLWDGLLLDAHFGTMDLSSVSPKDQHVDLGGFVFGDKRTAQ